MQNLKNEAGNLLPMTITEGVTVNVLPNSKHEFLLSTTDVALGYGVSKEAVRSQRFYNKDEFIDGKHFVSAVGISNSDPKAPHNKVFWTKRGVVRLGFFIKSERAKLFRDWAEELIIRVDEQRDLFGAVVAARTKELPARRKHNRLTPERLINVLGLVSRVSDDDLRTSITNELIGGC